MSYKFGKFKNELQHPGLRECGCVLRAPEIQTGSHLDAHSKGTIAVNDVSIPRRPTKLYRDVLMRCACNSAPYAHPYESHQGGSAICSTRQSNCCVVIRRGVFIFTWCEAAVWWRLGRRTRCIATNISSRCRNPNTSLAGIVGCQFALRPRQDLAEIPVNTSLSQSSPKVCSIGPWLRIF